MTIKIEGKWSSATDGWTYEASAKNDAGRVVARATANVGSDQDPGAVYGEEGRKAIEEATVNACRKIVPPHEK